MADLTPAKMLELNELVEADAEANYFECAPPEFARPFGLGVKHIGSVYVTIISKLDTMAHNHIMGLGASEPATEASLDAAIAVFHDAGCNNYKAQVGPLAQPAQLPDWLLARGFRKGRNWAKMFRGNEPVLAESTDLRVERIGIEQAEAYASVVLPAYGITPLYRALVKGIVGKPGWYHYLAFIGEKAVSAAAMFIKGETAWLGFMGTLSRYRGHGGQSAMLARRLEDGLAHDCKWFFTETDEETPKRPNPSFRNLQKWGFKLAYQRRNYYHQLPASPVKKVRHALFVAAHTLRIEIQRLIREREKA